MSFAPNNSKKELTENDIVDIVKNCSKILDEKKAEEISMLDLTNVNTYLDYFIICNGNSRMHCRALAKDIEKYFSKTPLELKFHPDTDSEWIIMDYGDVIVHIFTQEMREYYDLDKLWADAKKIV